MPGEEDVRIVLDPTLQLGRPDQAGRLLLMYDRTKDTSERYIESHAASFKRQYASMAEIIRQAIADERERSPSGADGATPDLLRRILGPGRIDRDTGEDAVAGRAAEAWPCGDLDGFDLAPGFGR